MSNLPFVLRTALPLVETVESPGRDVPASEDHLPAVLEIGTSGYVSARTTHITRVGRETMDEN